VDAVHIYRDGPAGSGAFLGGASYGAYRPDVGAAFGSTQFDYSGWSFNWDTRNLSWGSHTLYVYARSTVSGNWQLLTRSIVRSAGNPVMNIDAPVQGATVTGNVPVGGWAVDLDAVGESGAGVDAIHIYRDGPAGSGTLLGAATYGGYRPDVGAHFGSTQFDYSGWNFTWNTAGQSGPRTLYVYAHSNVSGNWQLMTRSVTVSP
jgi:hypothetical protein